MPISLQKLEKLLTDHGFVIKDFFIYGGECMFIEIFSIVSADTFIIYIPSDYRFRMERGPNAYKLREIKIGNEEREDLIDKYVDYPKRDQLEGLYTEVPDEIDESEAAGRDMETRLEDSYKKPIHLSDLDKGVSVDIKDLYRQIGRLKYCVQNLRYKIAGIFKSYLCVVNSDDSVDCYYIKKYMNEQRKIMGICRMELFYEKAQTVISNMRDIRNGIYKILDKNQTKHLTNLRAMSERLRNIDTLSGSITTKKNEYITHTHEYERMLSTLIAKENEKIIALNDLENNAATKTMYNDISYVHKKTKLEEELTKLTSIKEEVIKNLVKIRGELENLYLSIDKIQFDSSVMIDDTIKNLTNLESLSK